MTGVNAERTSRAGRRIAEIGQDGTLVLDAGAVAPLLELTPEAFMEEVRRGLVYQVHEQGTGEDSGRTRVTLRYRARQCVITLDALGTAIDVG